jgi:hypothetical protein
VNIETINKITSGLKVAKLVKAGPGQNPLMPQPKPKSAEPPINL